MRIPQVSSKPPHTGSGGADTDPQGLIRAPRLAVAQLALDDPLELECPLRRLIEDELELRRVLETQLLGHARFRKPCAESRPAIDASRVRRSPSTLT